MNFHLTKTVLYSSLFLKPIKSNEHFKVLSELQAHYSPGCEEVDFNVLKNLFIVFKNLCAIFLIFFLNKGFPQFNKGFEVVPIHKKSDTSISSNSRPIFIYLYFPKLVHKRLISYLCHKIFIYAKQLGFRPGYSTYMPLIDFCDKIANACENKEFVIGILKIFLKHVTV